MELEWMIRSAALALVASGVFSCGPVPETVPGSPEDAGGVGAGADASVVLPADCHSRCEAKAAECGASGPTVGAQCDDQLCLKTPSPAQLACLDALDCPTLLAGRWESCFQPPCATGDRRCSGKAIERCEQGRWTFVEQCPSGCSAGECKASGCTCNTGSGCQSGCACDPDCAAAPSRKWGDSCKCTGTEKTFCAGTDAERCGMLLSDPNSSRWGCWWDGKAGTCTYRCASQAPECPGRSACLKVPSAVGTWAVCDWP